MAETSEVTTHTCHAIGCSVEIAPKLLMCPRHWRMVPKSLQQKVWSTYRKGQEITKTPSKDYVTAAMNAVRDVARREALRG